MNNINNDSSASSPLNPSSQLFIPKRSASKEKVIPETTEQRNIESLRKQQLSIIEDKQAPEMAVDVLAFSATKSYQTIQSDKISQLKIKLLKQQSPIASPFNQLKEQHKRTLKENLAPLIIENLSPGMVASIPKEILEDLEKELEKLKQLTPKEKETAMTTLANTYHAVLPLPEKTTIIGTDRVWRGLNATQLVLIAARHSAGGELSDVNAPLPTEQELIDQVAERGKLPEFTLNETVAKGFGTNNYVAVFKIKSSYLGKGSNTESGLICKKEAPVILLAWHQGRL